MIDATTVLGLIAGSLTSLSVALQVYRIWQRKSAKDVSYKMYLTLSLGVALWILYGVLQDEIAITITNAVSLILNLTTLFLKWKFSHH